MVGLWGLRGVSLSWCLRRISTWSSASVGSSLARLGVNASQYLASVSGLTGQSPRKAYVRRADTLGPCLRSRPTAMGGPTRRWLQGCARGPQTLVSPCQRLGGRHRVWHPPSRDRRTRHIPLVTKASCLISESVLEHRFSNA